MDVNAYFHRLGLEMPEKLSLIPHCCESSIWRTAPRFPTRIWIFSGIFPPLWRRMPFPEIVTEGRGGLCFELNGSFGNLLRCLGYGVTDYAARYLRGEPTPPMRRHRVMRVQATDGVWLCDVGIGETAQREPIRLVEGLVQEQFGESYRLEKEDFLGWVLWDLYKGSWRKFYSFTEEPQLVADFVALNFYCEKNPESPFNKQEMFALKTLDGRRTLDGNLYKEIHNGTVTARELRPEEMPEAYARFGLAYGK